MSVHTGYPQELMGGKPLSPYAPVEFEPPEQEDELLSYPVTAVHVIALPPWTPTAHKNQWLFLLQVDGANGPDAVHLSLAKVARRSTKCKIRCFKRLPIDPDGHFSGAAKAAKMLVLPGYTVDTLLGKMEAMGLLHYDFFLDIDVREGSRWWIDRVLKAFHEVDVFPPRSMCEETWKQACEIRSALEEVWGEDQMPLITSYPSRMSIGIFYQPKIHFLKAMQTADVRYRIEACGEDGGENVDDLLDKYNLGPQFDTDDSNDSNESNVDD